MPNKVYEYGALSPFENSTVVAEQMSLAHKYSNKLVEIELARRAGVRAAQNAHVDVGSKEERVRALEAELETLYGEISASRKKTGGGKSLRGGNKPAPVADEREAPTIFRRADVKSLRAGSAHDAMVVEKSLRDGSKLAPAGLDMSAENRTRAKELKSLLKDARAEFSAAKRSVASDPDVVAGIAAANEKAANAVKAERKVCGVFWGTYLQVETAAQQARNGIPDPRFHRWTGDGHLAVQIQKGMPTSDVFDEDTRIRVVAEPGRRDRVLFFRVCSSETGKPVFAKFRFKMHRELPPGKVKWVHIIRRRVADHERWLVQFVVETEAVSVAVARQDCVSGPVGVDGVANATATKSVGVDVGWRLKDNGDLRVAVAVDEAGVLNELVLPAALIKKDEHVAGLQSLRSKLMDEMKAKYLAWLSTDEGRASVDDLRGIAQWKNPGRFVRVLNPKPAHVPHDDSAPRVKAGANVTVPPSTETPASRLEADASALYRQTPSLRLASDPGTSSFETPSSRLEADASSVRPETPAPRIAGDIALLASLASLETPTPRTAGDIAATPPPTTETPSSRSSGDIGSMPVLPPDLRAEIEAFLKQDRHLWQWQEHERMKVQHQRREMFRLFSVKLARNYGRVVLEKFDLRVFAKREPVEDGAQTDSRRYARLRALACVSGLRMTLAVACASRYVEIVNVEAAFTTVDCSVCKKTCTFNAQKDLRHECEFCGVEWDQDENAARNILGSAPDTEVSPDALAVKMAAKQGLFSKRQAKLRKRGVVVEAVGSNEPEAQAAE